jgi:hypothetical protein
MAIEQIKECASDWTITETKMANGQILICSVERSKVRFKSLY